MPAVPGDFAELYKYTLDENNRQGNAKADNRKKHKTGEPMNHAQRRGKYRQEKKTSLHSRFTVSPFFIDEKNELLYSVSRTCKETLCVPQVKRDHGETLRYKLFVELPNTTLMEHRGTAATTFALHAPYFWPNLKNWRTKNPFHHVKNAKPTKLIEKTFRSNSNSTTYLPDRDNPTT
jgi:hypothetical protein